MRVEVGTWDGALAIHIPDEIARAIAVHGGNTVEVTVEGGRMIVSPLALPVCRLDDLLASMSPDRVHPEIDSGPAVGNEAL